MVARRQDPPLRHRSLFGAKRAAVVAECVGLLAELEQVDAELAALAARRHRLVEQLGDKRRQLTLRIVGPAHARQPVPDGSVRLPPQHHHSTPLWGRRLRSACIAILRRAGALALPELHVLLHHHGYRVDSEHAVKALSDALRYEVAKGRLERVDRGVYGPVGPPRDHPGFTTSTPPCGPLDHVSSVFAPHAA